MVGRGIPLSATCSIEGCDRKSACRTWCWTHYDRWRRNGDPLTLGPRGERGTIIVDPDERFWSRVNKLPGGCWLWTGTRSGRGGYGQFAQGRGKTTLAHRISWEKLRGPIPEGLVIDHLCLEKRCVNPDHLEPVTLAVNSSRAARSRGAIVCGRGHALEGDARRTRKDGSIYCGPCANEAQAGRRSLRRAKRSGREWASQNPDEPAADIITILIDAIEALGSQRASAA